MGLFSRYERRILEVFTASLLQPSDLLKETPSDVALIDRVERHLGFLSPNVIKLFRLTLILFDGAALLLRGRRFVSLDPKGREEYMSRWKESRFYLRRVLYRLIESICYLNYYAVPEISKKIGFVPPPIAPRSKPVAYLDEKDLKGNDLWLRADVCVVGSGAGGAVVAKELAEKGRSVVILEEGSYFHIQDFGREPMDVVQRLYRNAGTEATLGLPLIILPTGKAVGGTTIINSGTCFRLPDPIIARWREEFGLKDLTSEGLKPYFDKVEDHLHVEPVADEVLGKNARIFARGLEKMGLKGAPLRRNVIKCSGAGMCCFGCPTDAKQSVDLSYLPRAIEKGAKLLTHCCVETVVPKGDHGGSVIARAVSSETGKQVGTVHVDARVVVLAAGTLNTPRLLRRNHIAIHNSHIGRHLSIHPAGKIIALFDEEVRGWEGVPQGYYYDGLSSSGINFEGIFTPPSFGSFNLSLPPRKHREVMEQYRHLASFGFMVTDEARGWIRWLPNGDPVIYYSIRRKEVGKFVKALRFISKVFLSAGAREIFTGLRQLPIVTQETGLKGFDQLMEYRDVRRTDFELAAFHPLGTCRMGADPSRSVVDSYGEVHGLKNLFVADGSIFPSPLGVNPQETIMAFATRTAEYIHTQRL